MTEDSAVLVVTCFIFGIFLPVSAIMRLNTLDEKLLETVWAAEGSTSKVSELYSLWATDQ